MQELECSSHLIGGHEILVIQVGLSKEETDNGDLSPVQVVGDAKHVILLFRWRLGLSLHEGDDVLSLTGTVIVIHSALTEHLKGGPGSNGILILEQMTNVNFDDFKSF